MQETGSSVVAGKAEYGFLTNFFVIVVVPCHPISAVRWHFLVSPCNFCHGEFDDTRGAGGVFKNFVSELCWQLWEGVEGGRRYRNFFEGGCLVTACHSACCSCGILCL